MDFFNVLTYVFSIYKVKITIYYHKKILCCVIEFFIRY